MLKIDGSRGEGGGQVLRTSLALSAVTGMPFEMERIRAKRAKPGLMRQHLTAAQALAAVCGGRLEGDTPGSQSLRFHPGAVRAGDYHFEIGTAGSATLVLQTVLPALLTANGASRVTVDGGTHNPLAPPFEFLEQSFLRLVTSMGPTVNARLDRWGFYPAGGGRISVEIGPAARLQPLTLVQRAGVGTMRARAVVANLPLVIAHRELDVVRRRLDIPRHDREAVALEHAHGQGNVLMIEVALDDHVEIFTAFGARGVTSETVAAGVVKEVEEYLRSGQPVSHHLADQLLIPVAMSHGGVFRTGEPSLHTRTNVEVVGLFLPGSLTCEQVEPGAWEVRGH